MTSEKPDVIQWLLDGDPAIRWQTQRDLVGASARTVARDRKLVASEGWGARLLAKQGDDGRWSGGPSRDAGLYTPKWTSTTYTLLLLRDLGLPPDEVRVRTACALLLDHGLRPDFGISYGPHIRSETCITGMVLSILSYFESDDDRLDTVANHLLDVQMPDGGWNCRRDRGATHSSMHTTISVLEGLRSFEVRRPRGAQRYREAQRRGREFLLAHQLFRSHRTGAIISTDFTRFVFPPRWHYDILRALDYFQAVDAPRDARLSEAIGIVQSRRLDDGRWSLEYAYSGKTYFALERLRAPSRWNTLRALRVLRWWQGSAV
ncbi:MAG: hypothetical protein V4550_20285 [Gemmatimonadota bacterium]